METSYRARLAALYRADFGDRLELVVRYTAVSTSGVLIAIALRTAIPLVWLVAYLGTQALYWHFARRSARTDIPPRLFRITSLIALVSGVVFVGLPLYLLSLEDVTARLAGSFALAGRVLFTLGRDAPGLDSIRFDCVVFAVSVAVILVLFLPLAESPMQRAVGISLGLAITTYYAATSLASYRRSKRQKEAWERDVEAQKSRALGQFVGGVAHDFNNKLTAIKGHLELLDLLEDPKDREAALSASQEAASAAAETVRRLLAAGGRARLRPESIPLGPFLCELNDRLRRVLDPRVTVFVEAPEHDLAAYADRDMLETGLVQLCLNAQDAMVDGGRVRLRALRRAEAPDGAAASPPFVVIEVLDSGPGVEEAALGKLAEPFYTTRPMGSGVGLGLSAVDGFAEQSGGTLTLRNAPAGGLSVELYLPAAEPDQLPGS